MRHPTTPAGRSSRRRNAALPVCRGFHGPVPDVVAWTACRSARDGRQALPAARARVWLSLGGPMPTTRSAAFAPGSASAWANESCGVSTLPALLLHPMQLGPAQQALPVTGLCGRERHRCASAPGVSASGWAGRSWGAARASSALGAARAPGSASAWAEDSWGASSLPGSAVADDATGASAPGSASSGNFQA